MSDSSAVDEEVLAQVAAEFQLGAIDEPSSYVDRGVSGEVYKLTTASGEWAAKKLFMEPDPAQLEVEMRLEDAARDAAVALPQTIRTTSGSVVAIVDGAHWRMSAWVDVSPDATRLFGPERLAEVGAVAATLHGLRLAAPNGVTPWLTTPPSAADWEALRDRVRESDAAWAPRFDEIYPELLRLSEFATSVVHDGGVLSHCDLGPANFGDAGDHVVVFDWERAGAIPPLQELGYVLNQWAGAGDTGEIAAHVVAGYRDRSGQRISIDMDMFACTACAWLNFFWGRAGSGNDRTVVPMLDQPVTVDSLEALVDLANVRR